MTSAATKIVDAMAATVPPGQPNLDYRSRDELQRLTAMLLDNEDEAGDNYRRYRDIARRELDVASVRAELDSAYRDKRVLVTGGTGCIGAALIRELLAYDPADVFCLYALSGDFEPIPGVVYLNVDIRDQRATRTAIRRVAPDVVFHCAAQRSPWLAEREVVRSLATNVLGTRNVLAAARDADTPRVVHASTGKAMRYYTSDIYAGSKKLAEWLVHDYAAEGRAAGFARFTHVVDNAVVLERVDESMDRPDGVMRLHDPDTHFYAQSAVESAQLLTLAGLDAAPRLRGHAIASLGAPAPLLDVVVGRMQERRGATPYDPTIYVSGADRGYENSSPPGLYDPRTAAEVSPLVNAVEAVTAHPMPGVDNVDEFQVALPAPDGLIDDIVRRIEWGCAADRPMDAAAALTRGVRDMAEAMFSTCDEPLFARLEAMAERAGGSLPTARTARSKPAA